MIKIITFLDTKEIDLLLSDLEEHQLKDIIYEDHNYSNDSESSWFRLGQKGASPFWRPGAYRWYN